MERCDEIRDDLIGFAEGELAPDAHRRVEAHLAGCAACAREAALLVETLTRARALPAPETPDAFWADFGATVRQRIAAETPPRRPFSLRVGSWGSRLSWLRPLPALGAAVRHLLGEAARRGRRGDALFRQLCGGDGFGKGSGRTAEGQWLARKDEQGRVFHPGGG